LVGGRGKNGGKKTTKQSERESERLSGLRRGLEGRQRGKNDAPLSGRQKRKKNRIFSVVSRKKQGNEKRSGVRFAKNGKESQPIMWEKVEGHMKQHFGGWEKRQKMLSKGQAIARKRPRTMRGHWGKTNRPNKKELSQGRNESRKKEQTQRNRRNYVNKVTSKNRRKTKATLEGMTLF